MSVTGQRHVSHEVYMTSLLNASTLTPADLMNPQHPVNSRVLSGKERGARLWVELSDGSITEAVAQGDKTTDAWIWVDQSRFQLNPEPVRKKTEVYYSGLSLVIPTTETNLIALLKTLTPTSGTLSQFFNTVSNKLNCYNDDASLDFKINIVGSWTAATPNRNMRLNFLGTNGNTLIASRNDASITPEVVNFQIFFSIDKDGNIATNGTAPVIQSYGSVFTATSILLIAEQVTAVASINPV